MTIRNWLRLFWTTLAVGTLASLGAALLLIAAFRDFSLMELSEPGFNWQTMVFVILAGSTISVISHVGFFSYLIVRDLVLGILRSKGLWDSIQLLFTFVAFEMTTYVRWQSFGKSGESWVDYTALPGLLLACGLLAAWWKSKRTNRSAFIPTLFFMFAVTILEAIPAMRLDSISSVVFMLVPLWVSNAWQILMLPCFLKKKSQPLASPSHSI